MSAISISPTFPTFSDTTGAPLESGYIYIGTAGVSAETNQVSVYWDAALTIPASQPIRTIGGYPVYNGSPAVVYVDGDYSITVKNKQQNLVYSSLSLKERISTDFITGAIAIVNGGTGATTAEDALTNLGAAKAGPLADSGITGAVEAGVNSSLTQLTGITNYAGSLAFRSYLAGLTMSTAGSSATMSIAAGVAMNSTNAYLMQLASPISKTTSAWAVGTGNGGLDTGAIANNTWYHFYVIRRPDTGVVDVVFSTSASSPTLPTNYTQFRRIGSGRTNGSAQWIRFFQDGDLFQWDAMSVGLDINATNPGTSAVLATITTPLGIKTEASINVFVNDSASGPGIYVSDPQTTDLAPSYIAAPLSQTVNSVSGVGSSVPIRVQTNTSSQIRYRVTSSGASTVVRIVTLGWRDTRGKDA